MEFNNIRFNILLQNIIIFIRITWENNFIKAITLDKTEYLNLRKSCKNHFDENFDSIVSESTVTIENAYDIKIINKIDCEDFEILFVNDYSNDKTEEVIKLMKHIFF